MSKMYVVKTDGKYTVNPSETPRYSDMIVYTGESLRIEAPATGYFSSAEQCKTVNSLAGKWLESKVTPKGGGEIVIKESCERIADGVNVSYIIATVEGSNALSNDEAVSGAGLIGEWVGKTGKKDTAKAPTAPVKTATPPANTSKTTPATGTKTAPPATGSKPAPVAPATKLEGVHWDDRLSAKENVEHMWAAADSN